MTKQRPDYTNWCFRDDILKDIKKDSLGIGKFVVVTGDMDPFSRTKQSVEQVLGKDFRFYPVLGNHDVGYTNNSLVFGKLILKLVPGKLRDAHVTDKFLSIKTRSIYW
jgi:hypothetical protein